MFDFIDWIRNNPQKVKFLTAVSAFGTSYYVYHLEKAPITGILH